MIRDPYNYNRLSKAPVVAARLLGEHPINTFTQNCDTTIIDWTFLLRQTAVTNHHVTSDSCLTTAFKVVDLIITGKAGTKLLRRLAYIRLIQLFNDLEACIRSERHNLQRHALQKRVATVAIDAYMNAQDGVPGPNVRQMLRERKRIGKRWVQLAGPFPLFALIYSDEAETVV